MKYKDKKIQKTSLNIVFCIMIILFIMNSLNNRNLLKTSLRLSQSTTKNISYFL